MINLIPGFKRRTILLFLFLLSVATFSGCGGQEVADGGTDVGNPAIPVGVATFESSEELEAYLKKEFAGTVLPEQAYFYDVGPVVSGGNTPSSPGMSASSSSSQTNVQEAGVDESDKVKNDGAHIYIARESSVEIVSAHPHDNMTRLSTTAINGKVDSLYLYGNKLVVLYIPTGQDGTSWVHMGVPTPSLIGMNYRIPVIVSTGVLVLDVSDPAAPFHAHEIILQGKLVSSRLTGGRLHVIQQFLPNLPPLNLWCNDTTHKCDELAAANKAAVEPMALDDLLPTYEELDGDGQVTGSGRLVNTEDFYRPLHPGGGSIATITTIDMDTPGHARKTTGIVADAYTVYASTASIYLAATMWNSSRIVTALHKFDITGEKAAATGVGLVEGRIINQFSLGEYKGVLRVATTTGETWNGTSKNHVYCLGEERGQLETMGSLRDIAPGERIYAARFAGDRGYLVTFVNIDPLFTLDLSDPVSPKIAGELKVPGYSDYIHPFGENHLITIGKDVDTSYGTALYQGLQLTVFDVTDFANPTLLHKELIGDRGTDSEALKNHKAFTFWAERGLLAIPVYLKEHLSGPVNPWVHGTHTFSGSYVYHVTKETGFEFLGRMETSEDPYLWNWKRGVFIDDSVYAVDNDAVQGAVLNNISSTVNTLDLSL